MILLLSVLVNRGSLQSRTMTGIFYRFFRDVMMSLNSAGWFGRGVNRSFPSSLKLSAQGKRKARRGKGKEEPAVRASVLYSAH